MNDLRVRYWYLSLVCAPSDLVVQFIFFFFPANLWPHISVCSIAVRALVQLPATVTHHRPSLFARVISTHNI